MLTHPYRESMLGFAPEVKTEMQEAIAELAKWRRWHPVIAGGALWSWAANHRARDVDIFMESTWRTRRLVPRSLGPGTSDQLGDKSTPYWSGGYPVVRYRTALPNGTPVDLVLTPWRDGQVTCNFDYRHLAVAFGPAARVIVGAEWYGHGALRKQHSHARPLERMKEKLEPGLWGSSEAHRMLAQVMAQLQIYWNEVANG